MRLLSVLGASHALSDHLVRHPEQWRELTDPLLGSTRPAAFAVRAGLLRSVGADPDAASPTAAMEPRRPSTRCGWSTGGCWSGSPRGTWPMAWASTTRPPSSPTSRPAPSRPPWRSPAGEVGEAADQVRLAVIAMGKCGGRELNYVSDVDVIFVHEPVDGADDTAATRAATQLASHLIRACSDPSVEGTLWQVDAALRPEGKAGPLSRTLASHRGYYERWAQTWEFQALLKARPVAGDLALGEEYVEMVSPMVWTAAEREGFVADTQAMRRRVLEHIPARDADRQLKLGAGGLRDVEFAVQLLQLVHGRADRSIRAGATLSALADLTRGGYVGREDGEALHEAYAFLRTLEHRIQLHQLRRTHVVPSDDDGAAPARPQHGLPQGARGGAGSCLAAPPPRGATPAREALLPTAAGGGRQDPRPGGPAVVRGGGRPPGRAGVRRPAGRAPQPGGTDQRREPYRLDPEGAAPGAAAVVRRGAGPRCRDCSASAGSARPSAARRGTSGHYATRAQVAERLAHLLATSRYVTDLLEREPQGVRMLGNDLIPLSAEAMTEEMLATAGRHQDDPGQAIRAVRRVRQRELLRIGAGDVLGLVDVADVGIGLSRLTDATLEATLEVAGRAVRAQRSLDTAPSRIAIVAMGRYGGFELSYGSDADVLFVHEPEEGADAHQATSYATAVANEVRTMLAAPGGDPPLQVDANLRPEGKQGALVRTLDAYAAYYAKWSKVWEAQALLRAEAVVGDADLRGRFEELINPLRFPEKGISEDDVIEVRRIKSRIDQERLPKGADPQLHLKLGRGGLADIEWTIQLLQMRYAGRVPELRTTQTLAALEAAAGADLLSEEDARTLATGWRMVSRMRNAVTLARGKSGDQLPRDTRERAAVATILGYPPGGTDEMVNDYLRATRRARRVVDRAFWE